MITKQGARKALAKRQNYAPKPIDLDPNFPHQNAFVSDTSRFIDAQCGRRSGKTTGLALRFFKTMEKYPRSRSAYLALTLDSAKSILWPVLQELNVTYGLGCTFTESKNQMLHPNGARLTLYGADHKHFVKRLKGQAFPAVGIDEAQDFGPHLQSLLDDVLTPAIADYDDGWIAITGTPGPVPHGYFFEVTHNRKYGYSHHAWTMLENPYMPNAEQFIRELKKKREWDDENPTYKREYRNLWVLDVEALWVRYTEAKNHYQELPTLPNGGTWNYIMGIDLGFKDADAIAVLAWSDHAPATYLVEEKLTTKQGITELVKQIEDLDKKYKVSKMVIDEGGLGLKIAEEIRRQKHIPVQQANKLLKQQNVEFLNDALRLGTFKAKGASRFAQDSYLVQIDWDKSRPDKIIIKKHPHSDIIDAVLYAFRESPAYTYTPMKERPKWGSKEWADAQGDEMFDQAMEHFEQQEEALKIWNPSDN